MTLTSTVLGTPDPRGLARFYADLLGWPIETDEPEWVTLRPGGPGLSFPLAPDHLPPTWPPGPRDQQRQLDLDVRVDDLVAATGCAQSLGARAPEFQPQDDVR